MKMLLDQLLVGFLVKQADSLDRPKGYYNQLEMPNQKGDTCLSDTVKAYGTYTAKYRRNGELIVYRGTSAILR